MMENQGMAGSPNSNDIFDVRKIRRLVELMKEHDLTEIDLRQEDTRIQLRRGAGDEVVQTVARPAAAASGPAASPAAAPVSAPPAAAPADDKHYDVITSPIVGTFYAAPDPNAPPYVKVGDHIGPETTVCIIEAMKVFNEIPAEKAGKIVAMLAKNGETVEYGQSLFKIDTTG
ncbi:MAG TPA: acetyl-CoA carboxylase biotin carboxyl carrier protein [Thermoguttaceae bacterium]|nr:acetyl-CoA carboxylase biotin carboxyl carrier protein [Thermoguttaceae bacterium]